MEPHPGIHRNFLLYWINRQYGHLRQGLRIIMSNCDFLFLDAEGERKTPAEWRVTLKNIGALRGFSPAEAQEGYHPFEVYTDLKKGETLSGRERTVKVKSNWSLGEILMEPIGYNPNLSGWWGAKFCDGEEWEVLNKNKIKNVKLLRTSNLRIALARKMYELLKVLATAGVTHMHHIINQARSGMTMGVMSFREFKRKYGNGTHAPCSQEQYNDLLGSIPNEWREILEKHGQHSGTHQNTTNLEIALKEPPQPGQWVQAEDGSIGLVEVKGSGIIHICKGKIGRKDGLSGRLKKENIGVLEIASPITSMAESLCNQETYEKILKEISNDQYKLGFFELDCDSFSVARLGAKGEQGVSQMRSRNAINGIEGITREDREVINVTNEGINRIAKVAKHIGNKGGRILLLGAADRGDTHSNVNALRDIAREEWKEHGSIWQNRDLVELKALLNLKECTFPQKVWGSKFTNWTTIWYSEELDTYFSKVKEFSY